MTKRLQPLAEMPAKTDYLGRVKLLPEAVALIAKYRDDTRETLFRRRTTHAFRGQCNPCA